MSVNATGGEDEPIYTRPYSGKQILLDGRLQPNTSFGDCYRTMTTTGLWLAQSKKRLQAAYHGNEDEYSSGHIKANTEHETRWT